MALQIIFADDVGTGVRVNLGTADDAIIAAGVVVGSEDNDAIRGTGNGHQVNVQGSVFAAGNAITLGDSLGDSSQYLLIGEEGYVATTSIFGAVAVFGNSSEVDNRGTIFGPSFGMIFGGDGASSTTNIKNSGLIEGSSTAIHRGGASTETTALNNTGEIRSDVYAYFGGVLAAKDLLVNSGLMVGDIYLAAGDDSYDGRTGRLQGAVYGGNDADTLFGGVDNDVFFGENGADFLSGGAGSDTLDGGTGADQMFGGTGNDTYVVDSGNDIVNEAGGSGIDLVQSSITFNLANAARVIGAVENLTLINVATALNGNGNNLNNVITGNSFNNTLNGQAGNDTLNGGLGNDVLIGGAGNDVLIGGLGKDTMAGGANNDIFRFSAATHSVVGANADVITDFDDFGNDRIDVSALFGPAMAYRHNGAFTAAGQVRIADIAGPDVIVQVNTGGSLAADFAIRLAGTTLGSMTASDFIL